MKKLINYFNQSFVVKRFKSQIKNVILKNENKIKLNEFLKQSLKNPKTFKTVSTNYGWFLIPKKYAKNKLIQQKIEKEIENNISSNIDEKKINEKQEIIEKWIKKKFENPNINHFKTLPDQLSNKKNKISKIKTNTKTHTEQSLITKKEKRITLTHAWNYFFSLIYHELPKHEKNKNRKIILQLWKKLTLKEKEKYRIEYEKLLKNKSSI